MKCKLLILLLSILFVIPAFAQNKDADHEAKKKEMLEFKLKFLGDEMGLNESQKKQFGEIYTQMQKERRAIHKKIKSADKLIKNNKNATEADYEKATKEIANAKSKMEQVEKKYYNIFSKFLTKKQIYLMQEAENKFNETMRKCGIKKRNQK